MKTGSFKKKSLAILMCVLLTLPLMLTTIFLTGCGEKPPVGEEPTVESIALNTDNVKKSFAFAEAFTFEGLKVTATMSDASIKDVPLSDCKVSSPNMSSPGKRNVSVTYLGKTARYEITVMEKVIPAVDPAALVTIIGENADDAYRVEAEAIKMSTTGAKPVTGDSFIIKAGNTTPITSGDGNFLGNFGVTGNFFGFTFSADKAYEDVSIVMAMAYGGEAALPLGDSLTMYLNNKVGNSGEISLSTKSVGESVDALVWKNIVIREISLKEGANTLLFEVLSDKVPNIDYIDFYVGKNFVSTGTTISEKTTYTKDFEDFDLEKLVERTDLRFQLERSNGNIDGTSKGTNPTGYTGGTEISTTLTLTEEATIKITMVAASVSDYKVKDQWTFSIDGKVLDKVEDKNIQDGAPGEVTPNHAFFEWRNTSLGKYDLTAGDHLFIAKLNGGNCNVDMFKFEVITFGETLEDLTDSDVTVVESGVKFTVEAEELTYSEGRNIEVPKGNAYHITSDYRSVGVKSVPGNKFGFSVYAAENAQATLNIFAAYGGEGNFVFDEYVRTKVNDTTLTTAKTLTKDEGEVVYEGDVKKFSAHNAFNWNWKIIPLTVSLNKGMNNISFTLKDKVEDEGVVLAKFDKFDLIVTKYADGEVFTIPEIMIEDCSSVIKGAGTYRVEAEKADNSGVSLAQANLNADHPLTEFANDAAIPFTSNLSVGKLSTAGNKIRVYVYSDADYADVSIKFSMSVADKLDEGITMKADDMLLFTLNDTTFTAGDTAVFTGSNNEFGGFNWEPFTVGAQALKKGINILEIEIKGAENQNMVKSPNMDYFEFIINA